MSPKDVVGKELLSCFGMMEYEVAIAKILVYLADDNQKLEFRDSFGWSAGEGWEKKIKMDTIDIHPSLFAMLCASGWISNTYFPKGSFVLSKDAIERLEEKFGA
jgi:hypothetical protein